MEGQNLLALGSHIYNLSLMGAMIDALGEAKAEQWAKAV